MQITEGTPKITEGIAQITVGTTKITEGIAQITVGTTKITEGIAQITTCVVNAYSITASRTHIYPGSTQFLLTININTWLQSPELSRPLSLGVIL